MITKFKRIALIFLALSLAIAYVPTHFTDVRASEPTGYGYALLKTDIEKTAYKAIAEGVRNCERTITFRYEPANYQETLKEQYAQELYEATLKALRLVMADYPEFFWFDGDGSLTVYHDSWTSFKAEFTTHEYSVGDQPVTKNNVNQYIRQVEDAAAKALKDMPGDTDLQKIHFLHDYLAENIDYISGVNDQTIYGALVEKKAVCAGYARAYQYLLSKVGIQCWYVTGNSISPSTLNKVAHAWNLVYLDGKCYYTDVTWDDQTEVFHAYYMLSRAECDTSHFPDHPEDLPASCGHTDLDYFEVHKGNGTGVGMLTGSYNANAIATCMKKVSSDTWSCHLEDLTGGGPQAFAIWLQQNQNAIAAALGVTGGYRWSLDTLWDEYQLTIQALPEIHYHDNVLTGRPAKNPTCTESGNIGYFVCESCGAWFKNWDGTEEIHDKDSVKIPALEHTYTKQGKDADQHWMECKSCGAEKPDSREFHYDNNKNGKCDVCNAAVEIPTEPPTTPPTQVPTQTPTQTPTQAPTQSPTDAPATIPTVEPTVNPSEEPSSEPVSEPSEEPTQEPAGEVGTESTGSGNSEPTTGTTEPTMPTEGNTTAPSEQEQTSIPATKPAAVTNGDDQNPKDHLLLFVMIGGVVVVAAVATAIVLIVKKKR